MLSTDLKASVCVSHALGGSISLKVWGDRKTVGVDIMAADKAQVDLFFKCVNVEVDIVHVLVAAAAALTVTLPETGRKLIQDDNLFHIKGLRQQAMTA